MIDSFWQDLRFGIRMLAKKPAFTLIALLTLALGISANTAVFSVINAVLLRPLPYRESDRIVMLWETNKQRAADHERPSPGNFLDLKKEQQIFEQCAAWATSAVTLRNSIDAEEIAAARVTDDFFLLFGIEAALGRTFLSTEIENAVYNSSGNRFLGEHRVVVISSRLWQRRFGRDNGIIDRSIELQGEQWRVIGVMPEQFAIPNKEVDIWLPWDPARAYEKKYPAGPPRDFRFLQVAARLKPAINISRAQSQLDSLAANLSEQFPVTNRGWGFKAVSLYDETVGDVRLSLLLLSVAVTFVLLVACANVASLLLARAAGRKREMAIRTALGATRGQIIRQILTESLLLAAGGCALGLIFSSWEIDLLISLSPRGLPGIDGSIIDHRVLFFTVFISMLTGVLFGLAPAWQSAHIDPATALQETGGQSVGGRIRRLHSLLVISEIALAMVLVICAGLLARSFLHLRAVELGFDSQNLLVLKTALNSNRYKSDEQVSVYYQQLIDRLKNIPSVSAVGAVTSLPMSLVGTDFNRPYWRAGETVRSGDAAMAGIRMATPGYFSALRRQLLSGREFSDQDHIDSARVIVINASLASKVWPGIEPSNIVGQQLVIDYQQGAYPYQIIGVVNDVRHYGLRSEPREEIFIPHQQNPYPTMRIIVRTDQDPALVQEAVSQAALAIDPSQPIQRNGTMEQLISNSIAPDRFILLMIGIFAAQALILAMIGIYGLISYSVNERRREIGIRMALGAQRRDILLLVLKQSLSLTIAGIMIGVLAAFFLTRLLASLLFGVSVNDPLTYLLVSWLLIIVSTCACYLPAHRAAQSNPMTVLKYD